MIQTQKNPDDTKKTRKWHRCASFVSYPFHQEHIQNFRHFADEVMRGCALVKSVFPGVFAAISAAASVGGNGDFFHRSGNKSDIEPNAFKSLNRYNTLTK